MRLFDTHTHLQDGRFERDRAAVIERARHAGMAGLVVLGEDVASSQQAVELARANDLVFAAAGCHPHNADKMDGDALGMLAELAQQPEVVAIGEIGLDFYRNLSSRDRQIDVFRGQLETARAVAKPVALHCRDAHDAMLPLLEEWSSSMGGALTGGRPLGVMHYFAGDVELGRRCAELGFMISIHTSITYPKSDQLREVARRLPLDVLVVETDSPYGAPQSMRGKRNEPANVLAAVEAIAEVRGEPSERIAEATTENALRLLDMKSRLTQPAARHAVS